MVLTETEEALISLLRASLWGEKPEYELTSDVLRETNDQTVAGLIAKDALIPYAASFFQYMYCQDELVSLFNEAGIPMAILKGSAAAVYYPEPYRRSMGDYDFIVPKEYFADAWDLLEHNGYVTKIKRNDKVEREVPFFKHRREYELHYNFGDFNIDISKYVDEGLRSIETGKIDDYEFPMLPPLVNGLVLLTHISHHLHLGLGLRQVIDWMMYVDRVLDDEFWYSTFQPAVENLGLTTLAITATALCQNYLGLTPRAWCQGADEELVDQLLEAVMTSGNFGIKTGTGNNVETVTAAMKSHGVFYYLQLAGEHNWELYHRYHSLRPVAWLYQIFRYIRQGIGRGFKLKDDIGRGSARADLLKKLGV